MTATAPESYIDEWKQLARADWRRMEILSREGDAAGAAFFLQQSLEKWLKAYLLARGWKLRKIHVLHTLLEQACAHDKDLSDFRDLCERISSYYLAERYPGAAVSDISIEEIQVEREKARLLIKRLFPAEAF